MVKTMASSLRYTIDASVFLNAFNPAEAGHAESNRFLAEVIAAATPVIVPTLLFPEVAATISRMHGDEHLARTYAQTLRNWPNLITIPLDEALSVEAVDAAARFRLRGSDAVYVAVAIRFDTTLVTLDREQRERATAAIAAVTPRVVLDNGTPIA